jgi:hypothetical protein
MIEGEIRRVTINLAGAVGTNTINDASVTSDTLTLGTPAIDGTSVSFTVTGSRAGQNLVLASCNLSSSETIKGYIRVRVIGEPCPTTRDY